LGVTTLRATQRKYFYALILTILVWPFQNCSGGFKSASKSLDSLASNDGGGNPIPGPNPNPNPNPDPGTGVTGEYVRTCVSAATLDYVRDVKPIIERNCKSCHMNGVVSGNFSIPNFASDEEARQSISTWSHALSAINSGIMPKGGVMSAADKATINQWFTTSPTGASDPGFVPIQRLTPRQWDKSVSDLLGMTVAQSHLFPADPLGKGQFPNNTSALAMINLEFFAKLRTATDNAVDGAFANAAIKPSLLPCGSSSSGSGVAAVVISADDSRVTYTPTGGAAMAGRSLMDNGGRLAFNLAANVFPQAVTSLTTTLGGEIRNGEWPKFKLLVDGVQQGPEVTATDSAVWRPFTIAVNISANAAHKIEIEFSNDDQSVSFRELYVKEIQFYGGASSGLTRACAEDIILNFARRAFRRPIATVKDPNDPDAYIESVALKKFVEGLTSAADLENGVKLAMKSILLSPKFLYRSVILVSPNDKNAVESLDQFELASQLSYFLWNTIPDDKLFNAALSGQLSTEVGIRSQVQRMLANAHAAELATELADGWFTLKQLQTISPSDSTFTESIRTAMREETLQFMQYIIQGNRDPLEIVTANFSFVNNELAAIYGMPSPGSNALTLQTLPNNRRGILGHASMMTLTTKGARTSPILRGVWGLTNVMCEPLPAPPPNIPKLEEPIPGTTVRDQLMAHRSSTQCASCHNKIDPVGLSFEHFDQLGRYRDVYPDGAAVDSFGELPDGSQFNGTNQFVDAITQTKKFNICLSKKVLSLAVARDVSAIDTCSVEKMGLDNLNNNKSFADFLTALIMTDPFKKRRGSGE